MDKPILFGEEFCPWCPSHCIVGVHMNMCYTGMTCLIYSLDYNTGYYPAYQVQHASSRTAQHIYYAGVSDFIYISKQSFVECGLCNYFEAQLSIGQ